MANKLPGMIGLGFLLFVSTVSSALVAESKAGIVDMQRVILTVAEGKKAKETLENDFKKKATEFKKQKEELDRLNKEWQAQAAILSEDARMRKQKEFQEKFMELRNAEITFDSEMKRREGEATQKIVAKASEIAVSLAKKKDLDFVFEPSHSGLIYVKTQIDLTSEIITAYESGAKTTASTTIPNAEVKPDTNSVKK